MNESSLSSGVPPEILTKIIQAQTDIVKLGHDLGAVMAEVAARLQDLTGSEGAIVEMVEGEEMVYRAATGAAREQLGLRLHKDTSLSGLCIEKGEVLLSEDSENDPRVDRKACRAVGLRSMVVSPLFFDGSPVGVLKITSAEPHFFTDTHVAILKLMSELIAAAMFHSANNKVKELYYRATHDMLTGLANRALFFDRLRQCVALARRELNAVGVLFMDMDGLKQINDTHGHKVGDAAIRELASRVKGSVRESDTVARLGGDEFGIILYSLKRTENLMQATDKIARTVEGAFRVGDLVLPLKASIGAAVFPDDARGVEELVEMADKKMYEVKRARKGAPGR